jgi:hypothetical protein
LLLPQVGGSARKTKYVTSPHIPSPSARRDLAITCRSY